MPVPTTTWVMPCTVPELAARFRAVLRRVRWAPIEDLVFPSLTISVTGRTVYSNGQWVDVSRQEFNVLVVLAKEVGRVVSAKISSALSGRCRCPWPHGRTC